MPQSKIHGTRQILPGTITDGSISSTANIQLSKLTIGSAPAQIIVTNASNIPTYVAASLDISLLASGTFTVIGLKGSILPVSTIANGFIKQNTTNTAWEFVAYGSTADTVCQGNDPRLAGGTSAIAAELAYAGWF